MTTQANDILDAAIDNLHAQFAAFAAATNKGLDGLRVAARESTTAHWTEPEAEGGYCETAEAYMVAAETATETAISEIEAILARAPSTPRRELDGLLDEIKASLDALDSALAPQGGGDDVGLADEHPWRSGYWTAAEALEELRDELEELREDA